MLHIIEHTIIDTIKLVPFLFLTYLVMEYLEHKASEKMENTVRKAGKWGPLFGSIAGAVPQCGFSAAASSLYAGRVITLGSLLAIYLSTSDEMLPILLSERVEWGLIVRILLLKIGIGMLVGFIVDGMIYLLRGRAQKQNADPEMHTHEKENSHAHKCDHVHKDGYTHEHGHIHDLCQKENCNCENGILRSAIKHTLQIFFFILVITFLLNLALHFGGEEALKGILLNQPIVGPIIAGLVGLIPNCVGSIIVTKVYLEGAMAFGTMMAGLLTSTGVGALILCRVNHNRKENIMIIGMIYMFGVLIGIIL